MKRLFICLVAGLFCSCASHKQVPTPSVSGVRIKVDNAGTQVIQGIKSSEKTGEHIRVFKSKVEKIDYKTIRALELI